MILYLFEDNRKKKNIQRTLIMINLLHAP